MLAWTSDDLERIGAAEELQLASVRRDGMLRRPVRMWVVGYGGDVYVRSVNGRASSWFRGVQVRREGHIRAGGVDIVGSPQREQRPLHTGARTAWRTHQNGQTIYVLEGIGLAQRRDGTIEVIRPGDRVFKMRLVW